MDCQRCRRATAAWLDTYQDLALCEGCCPDRGEAYGMTFVAVLMRADAVRLSEADRERGERNDAA